MNRKCNYCKAYEAGMNDASRELILTVLKKKYVGKDVEYMKKHLGEDEDVHR